MQQQTERTESSITSVPRPLVAREAAEHRRPIDGDLTEQTRRVLREARQREARFSRLRTPVEPMS
jgi:hypothetical protein